jgi:hypothetical protein
MMCSMSKDRLFCLIQPLASGDKQHKLPLQSCPFLIYFPCHAGPSSPGQGYAHEV